MSNIPPSLLDSEVWQTLPPGVIHAPTGDILIPMDPNIDAVAANTYQPVCAIPAALVVKTSTSEKRFSLTLDGQEVMSAPWGSVHNVMGATGSVVGIVIVPSKEFCGAYLLPDMAHLMGCHTGPVQGVIRCVHEHKMIKVYTIEDEDLLDVVVTTKVRWYRNRANPKALGFSKDER